LQQQQPLLQPMMQQRMQDLPPQVGTVDEAGPRTPPTSSSTEDEEDAAAVAANPAQVGTDPFAPPDSLIQRQQQQQQQPRRGRSPEQKFPFTQCANATTTFDVSFIGKVQYAQVGE
jgi:hypothetical protein